MYGDFCAPGSVGRLALLCFSCGTVCACMQNMIEKFKRWCVEAERESVRGKRDLVELAAIWTEISSWKFPHDLFLLPRGRIFSGFQLYQLSPNRNNIPNL